MFSLAEPTIFSPPLFTWSDCDPAKAPPNRYLVEGLIPEKGCHLVIGAPKAGKSQLTAHIIACILSGQPVFGRYEIPTDKNYRILWLLLEETRFKVRRRIQANLRGMGFDPAEITELAESFEDRIDISARDKKRDCEVGDMIFGVPRHSRWLLDAVHAGEYDIVVMDSLRPAHGYEENSSTAMKPVTDLMRELSEYGCGLILHHRGHTNPDFTRIGGDAGRGSSDLDAARDTAIHIQAGKFGEAMLIGFHHRDDAERFVAVDTQMDRDTETATWSFLAESEDPGEAGDFLTRAKVFSVVDAATVPEELPKLSDMKNVIGNQYRSFIGNLELSGEIVGRAFSTGGAGRTPTLLTKPGQFTEEEWIEAERRAKEGS